MNLAKALRVHSNTCLALVGAGGKTTALFQIAQEMRAPVIVAASSHLGTWQLSKADRHVIVRDASELHPIEIENIVLFTGEINDQRTQPVNEKVLQALYSLAKRKNIPILIEADGSRQKSLKAPAEHEPPIPHFVDTVIVIAGLSAVGKTLTDQNIHRAEIFSEHSGLALNQIVTDTALINFLSHPQGGLKNIPSTARRILLLNQADTPQLQAIAQSISSKLSTIFDSILITSLKENNIHSVNEPCAGIILAAGESKRYGSPKQLLDWKGKSFVRQVAETALQAGLEPVVLVTGAYAAEIESTLQDLPIIISHNPNWQNGQSESIKTGIRTLPAKSGAAIFLLADQPQIPVEVMRALIETHARELHSIVAPLVLEEKRANPVLFDRATFPDLLQLQGDTGGRAIFHKHKVEFLPWHDDILLLDVDKPEDYQRLIKSDKL